MVKGYKMRKFLKNSIIKKKKSIEANLKKFGILSNKGMSVIEIMVVVLLVGILATTSVIGISFMNRADAQDSAKRISALLDKGKLYAVSGGYAESPCMVMLYKEGNNYYGEIIYDKDTASGESPEGAVKIGKSSLNLVVIKGNGDPFDSNNDITSIEEGIKIVFEYDRASGAFKENSPNPEVVGGNPVFEAGTCKIGIQGTKTLNVVLVQLTGRNYIE